MLENGTCTLGMALDIDNKMREDAEFVKMYRLAGGIPFVKTNLVEMCMGYRTENDVWGRCVNPWNAERGPGGSSGGEAFLIASGCSPLGIGSDIGGSIRVPA